MRETPVLLAAGDVAQARRRSSADDRTVPVRTGHSHQRRLQPEDDRVEPHHPGRAAERRGLLLLPDQWPKWIKVKVRGQSQWLGLRCRRLAGMVTR